MHSRRERVRRALSNPDSPLSKLSQAELSDIVDKAMSAENKDGDGVEGLQREEHQWIRRAGLKQQAVGGEGERRLWGGHNYDPYTTSGLASEVEYYGELLCWHCIVCRCRIGAHVGVLHCRVPSLFNFNWSTRTHS